MGQGLSTRSLGGSPLTGPGSPPSPCCAARARRGRGRWCGGLGSGGDRALGPPPSTPPRGTGRGGRGERCWRPGRSRVAGGRRGWRAAAEEGAHPDKPRSPDFWPSPGRWGALAGALRGSPPLSGGFFLFKQSPPLRTVDLDPPLSCSSKQPRA